jgi:hypothetical protein
MNSKCVGVAASLMAVIASLALGTSVEARLVGLAPHDGLAVFAKAFTVPAGRTIEGVAFTTDGASVTFPKVSLLRGPAASLHQATTVSVVEGVASGARSTVIVSWPSPVGVTEACTYYVVVQLPVSAVRLGLTDRKAPNGTYIASVDEDGLVPVVGELEMTLLPGEESVVVEAGDAAKAASAGSEIGSQARTFLRSGSPNPTTGMTVIDFGLERSGVASLIVYDVTGREVQRLVEGELGSGLHRVQWSGRDSRGRSIAAGVYFINLRLGERLLTERVVIAK